MISKFRKEFDAQQVNNYVEFRQHWGIENKLHWSLDVTLKEDLSTRLLLASTPTAPSIMVFTVFDWFE